jgi:phenylalanyl-tRNA synthetase beta subunit
MVHPATLKAFDIDVPVAIAGIHLDAIPAKKASGFARAAYAPPALQAVKRDFAFLVDAALPAGDLIRVVKAQTRPTWSPCGCSMISGAKACQKDRKPRRRSHAATRREKL